MISEIQIENFKSIASLTLEPGDVTVLIGENGSGKSNILEAIAFAAAASVDKLDDEFLFNRGVRVTDKLAMLGDSKEVTNPVDSFLPPIPRAIFKISESQLGSRLMMAVNYAPFKFIGKNREHDWFTNFAIEPGTVSEFLNSEEGASKLAEFGRQIKLNSQIYGELTDQEIRAAFVAFGVFDALAKKAPSLSAAIGLRDFLIYAPENTALRNFETEGAIKPLGVKGEGLLKLLTRMAESDKGKFSKELNAHLQLLGWFGELHLPTENDQLRGRVRIRDRYLGEKGPVFDQRSANEGFLYLLFYFTLMLSKQTPAFFAIDNIDNALNPKLCSELIRHLAKLAKKMGKQMICTTHNPAILDGLNLKDDRQRLYVVRRDSKGHTVADRVKPPRPRPGGSSVKLSEAFMSGLLGGLPEHF